MNAKIAHDTEQDDDCIDPAFIKKLRFQIGRDSLVPIIGDTVRDEDIFDFDDDNRLGIAQARDKPLWEEVGYPEEMWRRFSITEKLSSIWAKQIGYPMPDRYKIERVSFYQAVKDTVDYANASYLQFRKEQLVEVARQVATVEQDSETLAMIEFIENRLEEYSFSDIAVEFDFPRYGKDDVDPLRILAKQQLSTYVTTDQHDFLERAIRKEGRRPRTRLCWPTERPDLRPEHVWDGPYKPTIQEPVVYHLCGYEEYPGSLVVNQDSYLDLLIALTEEDPTDKGDIMMPAYLTQKVQRSSLLLLGYRFWDWDFRVVFRSMLEFKHDRKGKDPGSFAIHFDLSRDPELRDKKREVREYLLAYFGTQRKFDICFGPVADVLRAFDT